jgi:hypothetical protein
VDGAPDQGGREQDQVLAGHDAQCTAGGVTLTARL